MVVDTALNPDLDMEKEDSCESEQDLEHDYIINLSNGKKNLLCNDFPEAVSCFQAACSSQSERFGDTSPECAEAFFYYGRALLELARVENGVLGNALKGVPETEDSDSDTAEQFEKADKLPDHEREQLRQDVEAAMAKEENEDAPEVDVPDNKNVEEKQDDDAKDVITSEGESSILKEGEGKQESNSDEPSTSSGKVSHEEVGEENLEDPDEISNMQLAWEMLELAKVLYTKKPKTEENNLMIAQCLLKLGELSLEIENYSQAIADFLESLSIHTEFLSAHDRRMAETHYNLGLAYSFTKQHDDAIKHYQAALAVLESRIDFLNELIDENDQKKEKEEDVMQECAEVGELKNLIPDINSKIEDVIMMKRQEARLSNSPFAQKGETSTGFGSTNQAVSPMATLISVRKEGNSSTTSPAPSTTTSTDISHLVRRKRPTTDEGEAANKKIKCDQNATREESNGNGEQCVKNNSTKTEDSTKEVAEGIENQPPEIHT